MSGEGYLGHYRLVRLLGRGGMGQVWLAEDTKLEREVALKLLPSELAADQDYRRRFEREARSAARLRGQHVVPIHAFGELDGRLYIDMELVEGSDLGKVLNETGALTPERAVDLVAQVAEALDIAHRAGLVHRDVKPSNVLTLPSGYAYLIDFGIARGTGQSTLTATGVAVGTWAYMAPERYSGTEDLRSDIYSLACLLFECLTGAKPFAQTDPVQQMAAHLTADPPRASAQRPAVPAALDTVIAKGMAKEPQHRYPSAGTLALAARAALEGRPAVRTAPSIPAPPTTKWDGGQPPYGYGPGYPGQSPTPYGPNPTSMTPFPAASRDPNPYTPPPAALPVTPTGWQQSAAPHGFGVAAPPPNSAYSGPQAHAGTYAPYAKAGSYGQPSGGFPRAAAGPRIGPGRITWWVCLPLLLLIFGTFTFLGVHDIFTRGFPGVAVAVLVNVFFDVPFVVLCWLAVRDIRRFGLRK
ncbi:protein kinase domain-containing protein [Nocardia sp. NBC_00511]|uniref:serine/threonine-protein kinase n=1 Tax=Nocardia sp. NBC_00511 TaxID=2903591 RepID=UPI0030E59D3F